jgi:hypothetical protein
MQVDIFILPLEPSSLLAASSALDALDRFGWVLFQPVCCLGHHWLG